MDEGERRRLTGLLTDLREAAASVAGDVVLMEVCGTHTVNAARGGVASLLPGNVRLVSGPGCPVCVTPQSTVDALIALGRREEVILATYGDLVRVPGEGGSLERARSEGADVRVVTSSLQAVATARAEPDREVVFAAIGFETTAPATAAAVLAAGREGLSNFSVLTCHKRVLPALRSLLADPEVRIDGLLCPGHVSVVIGAAAYRPLARDFARPCVVAGFTVAMIVEGILHLVLQKAAGTAVVENLYLQAVDERGNPRAAELIDEVLVPADTAWRALGTIPESGLVLREKYREFDARRRFGIEPGEEREPPGCRCGEVITGRCDPPDCDLFGNDCTPVLPVGPCMVSSEGVCRAWLRYRPGGER